MDIPSISCQKHPWKRCSDAAFRLILSHTGSKKRIASMALSSFCYAFIASKAAFSGGISSVTVLYTSSKSMIPY